MNPLLTRQALDLAGRVLSRILDTHQVDDAKRKWLEEASQLPEESVEDWRSFMLAYEGKGEYIHPKLQFLRGSVRPVLTYVLALVYAWCFLHPGKCPAEALSGLFQLNLISMGFWFGERTLKNLGLNLGTRKDQDTSSGDHHQ